MLILFNILFKYNIYLIGFDFLNSFVPSSDSFIHLEKQLLNILLSIFYIIKTGGLKNEQLH